MKKRTSTKKLELVRRRVVALGAQDLAAPKGAFLKLESGGCMPSFCGCGSCENPN